MALLAGGVSELFIDGKFSPGSGGAFQTINPATEEVLGVAADANADDMSRAIDAASSLASKSRGCIPIISSRL